MNRSRITGAILLRWDDCTSILSKHLTTLLQRPIQLCHMVEDYDYWCIALKTGRFSIPELHVLLNAISATTTDFPDLIPEIPTVKDTTPNITNSRLNNIP